MVDNAGYDSPDLKIPKNAWDNAIASTQLAEAMALSNLTSRRTGDIKVRI
jgi:hypothetical protein